MTKLLEGYVDDGQGAPLSGIPAVATRLTDGVVVASTVTDSVGHWTFAALPTAAEYLVTLTDPDGNAVARAPWSGELREAWVRDRLTATGPISVEYSGAVRISNFKAAGSLQRPAVDFERWKTTVGTIEEVTVGSTVGTFGFNASGSTNLAYGGSIYAYVDAPIVGGTAPIAFSFYHATLGETYRLDSQGRGWFAPPEDTSTFPATPGLYISSKWVGVSPDVGNTLQWRANGFYVP